MTQIARKLNETSANEGDRYLDYINEGMEDINNHFPQAPWLQSSAVLTLAAGSGKWQTSSIASDVRQIKDVRISAENAKLQFVEKEVYDSLNFESDATGIPSLFTVYNDEIEFGPFANNSYGAQVTYSKTATTVSAASAVIELPRRFLPLLTMYCQVQGLEEREDFEYASAIEAKYEQKLRQIKRELRRVILGNKRMITSREIQDSNRVYNDEITQTFFGA